MSELEVRFLGCGDAFGSGGRYQTCIHLRSAGLSVLLDCGATSLSALRRFDVDPATIEAVIVSHLHGDHFGGLPFLFLDGEYASRRSLPLTVAGPPTIETRTRAAQEVFFPGSSSRQWSYELRFVELVEERPQEIAGIEVIARAVEHPSGAPSYGLRLRWGDRVVAYSGDTEWTDSLLELARGADLFICECYQRVRKAPYHLDYETLLTKRRHLDCRRLVLTHLHRSMLECENLEIETAEDGRRFVL